MQGRYQRSVDEVYHAAVTVINNNGVLITEFIPHDTTNAVRSLQGKVNQGKVWVRVEAVDPQNHPGHRAGAHDAAAAPTSTKRTNWTRKSRCNWRGQ